MHYVILKLQRTYNPRQKSLKHLSTPLSHCNVEMGLQCYVVTATTLQKGGGGWAGGTKGAEFSKVFQGFCLRLKLTRGRESSRCMQNSI